MEPQSQTTVHLGWYFTRRGAHRASEFLMHVIYDTSNFTFYIRDRKEPLPGKAVPVPTYKE